MSITKYVLPVVVGAMSGMILITLGEMVLHNMYPLPVGTDLYDADSLNKAMKVMPVNAFYFLLCNYVICSFIAGVVATLVSKRTDRMPAMVVGIVLTLGGVYNDVYLYHPGWFIAVNLLSYLPCTLLGYYLIRKKGTTIAM